MFIISFEYNEGLYKAVVTEKNTGNKQYRITGMNGELESLLHGNNVVSIDEVLRDK